MRIMSDDIREHYYYDRLRSVPHKNKMFSKYFEELIQLAEAK